MQVARHDALASPSYDDIMTLSDWLKTRTHWLKRRPDWLKFPHFRTVCTVSLSRIPQ